MSQLKVNKIAPLSGNSLTILDDDGSTARVTIDTSGNVGIGQTSPGAKLEIEVGSADGVTGLLIDANDADQNAVKIEAAQTTAHVIDLNADSLTTYYAMNISADALTSGRILSLDSNSSDSNSRQLVYIRNDNTSATGCTPLYVRQDAVATGVQIYTAVASQTSPLLELYNANADSQAPILRFNKNGSSPAANDECGEISFYSEDSANNATEYGNIQCIAVDETSGSEEGAISFSVARTDGTLAEGMRVLGHASGARVQVLIGKTTSSSSCVLDVVADSTTTYCAIFHNDGNNTGRKGILVQCGGDGPNAQGQNIYIAFADGDGTASGGIQNGSTVVNPEFFNGSDERIKRDIAPTQVIGLDVINALEMKEFRWNPNFCEYDGLNRIGFIAQNCEQAYPEMVSESPDERFDFDVKSVAKGELMPVLVKAVQELSAKVDLLEAQLSG